MSISRCFILIYLSSSILHGSGVLSSSSISSMSSTYVSGNWLIGYSTIFSISVWPYTRADIFGATVCNCTFCDPVALFDLELLSVLTGHWSSSPFLQPGLYTLHSCKQFSFFYSTFLIAVVWTGCTFGIFSCFLRL